jgi:cytochrome c oxidase subunit 4
MSSELAHAHTEEHATVGTYIKIAVILTIITILEVGTYYVHIERTPLIIFLILMSASKFFIVVGWYMHLKYDNRIFRRFFLTGLFGASAVLVSIVLLFAYQPFGG